MIFVPQTITAFIKSHSGLFVLRAIRQIFRQRNSYHSNSVLVTTSEATTELKHSHYQLLRHVLESIFSTMSHNMATAFLQEVQQLADDIDTKYREQFGDDDSDEDIKRGKYDPKGARELHCDIKRIISNYIRAFQARPYQGIPAMGNKTGPGSNNMSIGSPQLQKVMKCISVLTKPEAEPVNASAEALLAKFYELEAVSGTLKQMHRFADPRQPHMYRNPMRIADPDVTDSKKNQSSD